MAIRKKVKPAEERIISSEVADTFSAVEDQMPFCCAINVHGDFPEDGSGLEVEEQVEKAYGNFTRDEKAEYDSDYGIYDELDEPNSSKLVTFYRTRVRPVEASDFDYLKNTKKAILITLAPNQSDVLSAAIEFGFRPLGTCKSSDGKRTITLLGLNFAPAKLTVK